MFHVEQSAKPFPPAMWTWAARSAGAAALLRFPAPPVAKLRTTNVIERCFVELRRRTRPMVVFTDVQSVDRIIFAIFSRFNEDWKNHTLELFTQAA
jgi:transposase-like protein